MFTMIRSSSDRSWDFENKLLSIRKVFKMPITNYISVNGRMLSEVTDGVILDYVPDALGSIHSVVDQTATVVKTMRYKPYGEVLSRSGSISDRMYQWVGTYGYRATFNYASSHYVRARHYSQTPGAWTTVDPLWPDESGYGYCDGSPRTKIDPQGLGPGGPGTIKDVLKCKKERSRAACFWCAYKIFSNRHRGGGFNYCPQKACDEANSICGSHLNCGPCGPSPVPVPTGFECDRQALESWGQDLRLRCGGMGADKLAHCVKGCLIRNCLGVIGVCLWHKWLEDEHKDDSDAEAVGINIGVLPEGDIRQECIRECAKAIYDWQCDG